MTILSALPSRIVSIHARPRWPRTVPVFPWKRRWGIPFWMLGFTDNVNPVSDLKSLDDGGARAAVPALLNLS